jgi:hypothetical protein
MSKNLITVSEGNTRFKKREGIRDKGAIVRAFLITGGIFGLIVWAIASV